MQKFVVTTLLADEYEHSYYTAKTVDAVYDYLFKSEYILTDYEDICFRFRNIDPETTDLENEIDILLNTITIDEIKEYLPYYHTGGYGYQEKFPKYECKTVIIEKYEEPEFTDIYEIMKTVEEIKSQRIKEPISRNRTKKIKEVSLNLEDVKKGNIKKLRKMIFRNETDEMKEINEMDEFY